MRGWGRLAVRRINDSWEQLWTRLNLKAVRLIHRRCWWNCWVIYNLSGCAMFEATLLQYSYISATP